MVLIGLHVAQIRCIFNLPAHYGQFPHPLAYIEWFQPFPRLNAQTGFYRLAQSTWNQVRFSAVVGVHELFTACHLSPRMGSKVNASWTIVNVLEQCNDFYVNPYINFHIFDTLEQINYGSIA
jgi:hypothetical protein